MMNADDGPPISHWTRFRPKPECLPTISSQSEDGKKWKEIMRPLLLAPGHIRTHWGPVIEEEGDWILVTAWESQASLDAFQSSADGQRYLNSFSAQSTTTLSSHLVDFSGLPFYIPLAGYTGLIYVHCPPQQTAEQDAKVKVLKGLRSTIGRGLSGDMPSPHRRHPSVGVLVEPQDFEGQKTKTRLFCHFWTCEESEREFMASPARGAEQTPLSHAENWRRSLTEAGALGTTELHCKFTLVPATLARK